MQNFYVVVRTGQDNTDVLCALFSDRAEAVNWTRLQFVTCPKNIHVKEVALVPVEEVDLSVLTPDEAVTQLSAMVRSDPEKAHAEADRILCNVLRGAGPKYAAVADAYYAARDTVGSWYS